MKTNYVLDKEAKEYNGCSYQEDEFIIIERTAKITPKKIGQFVTFWKRNSQQITTPYSYTDLFDFLIIKVNFNDSTGYFKFSKDVLIKNGIISSEKKEGKRGFRVYPIWDKPTSKQALKTQQWQLKHFSYD